MTLAEQRKLLAAWLAEWRLERELPPPPAEKASGTAVPADGHDAPDLTAGGGLARGDIILLPPVGEVAASRPVYVALLRESAPGVWLCAPFSRFSTPATEGEYATGRAFDPLKVVCARPLAHACKRLAHGASPRGGDRGPRRVRLGREGGASAGAARSAARAPPRPAPRLP